MPAPRLVLAAIAALAPLPALAVMQDDTTPPAPTPTTLQCAEGTVWNPETRVCEAPKQGMLDDDRLFDTARELAYAGRYRDALAVLAAMAEGETDRVLTVKGYATRRMGDVAGGMALYAAALARNPDNLLVRSYMGEALVAAGRRAEAEVQLAEIVARGGAGSWAEQALREALRRGQAFRY